jgi:hypothetical protein
MPREQTPYLEYLRAFAGEVILRRNGKGSATEQSWWVENRVKKHTVEALGLGKEPFEPTSLEIQLVELFDPSLPVYFRVVGELGAFDEAEDDGVFEPS